MLRSYATTDIGRKRQLNQDFIYLSEVPVGNLPNVFIVADGMGGHNAGDYASRLAVETIVERSSGSLETNPLRVLDEAVQSANGLVRQRAQEAPELQGMGTTVVAAVIDGRELYVANVGDSRLYIVNSGEIRQITKDHSWVEEMVRRGGIGKAEARNHPDKNIITRAVGAEETVRIDFFQVLLQEGDVILMCTDGLTNMLEDEEIRMTLDGARDIVEKAQGLVRAANERGGRDNISVVLIEFI